LEKQQSHTSRKRVHLNAHLNVQQQSHSMKNRLIVLIENLHNEVIYKQKPFCWKEVTDRDHWVSD